MTGEELKKYRIRRQYTQRQLGEALGYEGRIAENMIQQWEYGKRPVPIKHYRQLSKLLDIPLEKLIP